MSDLTATRVGELKRALAGLAEVASFYKHSSDPLPPEGSDLCAQLHERIQQANELIKMLAGWHDPKSWRVPATSRELDPCGRGAGIEPDDLPEIPMVTIPQAELDGLKEGLATEAKKVAELIDRNRTLSAERDAAKQVATDYLTSAQDYAKEVEALKRSHEAWQAETERLRGLLKLQATQQTGMVRAEDLAYACEWRDKRNAVQAGELAEAIRDRIDLIWALEGLLKQLDVPSAASPLSTRYQEAKQLLGRLQRPQTLIREAARAPSSPTPEQVARGAEILRGLKEPPTRGEVVNTPFRRGW